LKPAPEARVYNVGMDSLQKFALLAKTLAVAVLGAGYAASPIDALPDVLLGIGWLDDLLVLALAALYVRRLWLRARRPHSQTPTVTVIPQIR